MRWDWYQGTVPERDVQVVSEVIASAYDSLSAWRPAKGMNGYDRAAELALGHVIKARMMWGGVNADHGVHVIASGDDAPALAARVRQEWPSHKVSRFDACEDYNQPGAYEVLRGMGLKVAKEHDVEAKEVVSHEGDKGCTLYLGSHKSAVVCRIYEKGKQLGGKVPNWVRAELQVRPKSRIKELCSRLPPSDVWGLTSWSHTLARRLGNTELQRVAMSSWRQSDFERCYSAMLRQYGKTLLALQSDLGSWECVGLQLGSDLAGLVLSSTTDTEGANT